MLCFSLESASMVGYPADSDSENEEGVMEKLACAIGHLFTGYENKISKSFILFYLFFKININ